MEDDKEFELDNVWRETDDIKEEHIADTDIGIDIYEIYKGVNNIIEQRIESIEPSFERTNIEQLYKIYLQVQKMNIPGFYIPNEQAPIFIYLPDETISITFEENNLFKLLFSTKDTLNLFLPGDTIREESMDLEETLVFLESISPNSSK